VNGKNSQMKPIERFNPRGRAARGRQEREGAHHAILAMVSLALCGMVLVGSTHRAMAQGALIHHKITQEHLNPPATGREFWWAIPSNFFGVDEGGKYLRIYITSAYNTTAYVGIGTKTVAQVPVTAFQITTYIAPEAWEIETSGDVEDNAVHIWSKDADLTVYFMSHNLATSDGAKIIPTIGWGTDYVVAGYEGLFEGTYDYPSEFTIAANTDNTVVQVTPSCNLRGIGDPTVAVYPVGQTFQVRLDRGQSVQYMSTQAQDVEGYDVTGTILHSNNPIGVIGGAMCTNIPINFQYCDHVEDMIPPIRTWAETYYGTYFAQPSGQPGHDWAQYLFISSKAGQIIHGHNKQVGDFQATTIQGQYAVDWEEYEKAQKFWSDAPFLMVEYINSSSYPDQVNGDGDPAEVVVNPREQYTKTVVFQTPYSGAGQRPFSNYATVIVNIKDETRTTFDGKSIMKYLSTVQHVDDTFDIFTVPSLPPGVHTVTGDSAGVGVYVYGYGYDESYAWGGGFGTGTFHATDTVSPRADTMGLCYDAFIHLADFGLNPGGIPQSKLNKIQIDSDYNMNFALDTDWAEGVGLDTSGYGMSVLNNKDSAYLQVSVYDVAGNVTTITSTYYPNVAVITPPVQDFGTVSLTGSATLYDTIRNVGATPFDIKELKLRLDTEGFTLVNADLSSLPADSMRILEIQFSPKKGQEAYDTIDFGSECLPLSAIVEGNAGAPDFSVDDQSWINVPLQIDSGWIQLPVIIHNKSTQPLGVKFDGVSDKVHFYLAPYQKDSVTVPAKKSKNSADGLDSVWFIYQPTAIEQDGARGSWHSPDVLEGNMPSIRNDSLHGNPITALLTFAQNIYDTVDCASAGDTLRLAFILNNAGSADAVINRVSASDTTHFTLPVGIQPNDSTWDPSKSAQLLAKNGGTDTIVVYYVVPVGVNRVDIDTLTATDAQDQPLQVIAQIVVQQLNMTITPPTLDFGQVPYQSGKITQTITITNPNPTPVTYTDIFFGSQSGNSNGSFTISPSAGNGLPVTLAQGQSLSVSITLDPSKSFTYYQWAILEYATNACSAFDTILVLVHSPGPAARSTSAPPILACNHAIDSITISDTTNLDNTIVSINWLGADSSVFSLPMDTGLVIAAHDSLKIPVQFLPNAQDSNLQTYIESIQIGFKTSQGGSFDTVSLEGTANYATAVVTSQFATLSSRAGNQVMLPMNLTITHPGFAMTNTDLDITGVHLVYLISNPDLLNIDKGDVAAAVSQLPPGWSVQPGSYVSKLGDTLSLYLQGPKITDAVNSFGQIAFRVMLPKIDSTTNVTLDSLEFFSDGVTSGCITPVIEDSNFSLILECGDPTLRSFMQGKGIVEYIRDASPDPVTGSYVTFNYGNQTATNVTLAIYDVLGREVARPVDNVYHEAGSWQVSCNVARLPSGTYTYRLSANGRAGKTVISKQFEIQR